MGDPPVQQENGGRINVIDPGDENIQVGSDAAQHQGCQELFFQAQEACQEIGQEGMKEEVHYRSYLYIQIFFPLG